MRHRLRLQLEAGFGCLHKQRKRAKGPCVTLTNQPILLLDGVPESKVSLIYVIVFLVQNHPLKETMCACGKGQMSFGSAHLWRSCERTYRRTRDVGLEEGTMDSSLIIFA